MKKLILLALAIVPGTIALAQNGFYLSPSMGVGMANAHRDYNNPNAGGGSVQQSGIFTYNAGIGVGYRYKNWRFETGVQYLKTGYQLNNLLFSSDFDPDKAVINGTGQFRITYNHIGIPLQAGYAIKAGNKFSLVPYLGLLTSYNLGASSRLKDKNGEQTTNMTKDDFKEQYNSISFWGNAALHLEYKTSNRISIFGGPSTQYMISNFEQKPTSSIAYNASQRNYSINFDLGAHIRL